MKICHIMDSGGFYGKERVVMELVKKQVENEHYVQVICLGPKIPALVEKGIEIGVGKMHMWFMDFKAGFRFKDIRALKLVLSLHSFDIIHVHGEKESVYAILTRWGLPLVRTLHGYTNLKKFTKAWVKHKLDRFLFEWHNAVIGVSDDMVGKYGVTHVIKNGIECREFNTENLNEKVVEFCKDDHHIIGCTARFSSEKNLNNLVLAMTLLPENYKLLLLGNGPLLPEIHQMIISHRLENRVHMAGFVPNAFDYLSLIDIYIQPSYTEGTPISVLEAMCAKKNIIMTAVGGMKYLLSQQAGWECDTTPHSIAETITHVSVNSDNVDYQNRAKNLFDREYSIESMYMQYNALYSMVLLTVENN